MANQLVQHSTLSFSGRERWRNCPVSVVLSKDMPDNSGPAAEEGTAAHRVAEFYVRQHFGLPGAKPGEAPDEPAVLALDRFQGKIDGDFVREEQLWNEELRKHGKAYCAYVQSLIPPGSQAFVDIEQRVAATSIDARLFGTLDLRIWFPTFRVLLILDYKYGFMDVDVGTIDDPNPQLAAYAVASLDTFNGALEGVMLAVFQPRRPLGEAGQKLYLPASWVAQERAKLANEVQAVDVAAQFVETGKPVAEQVKPGDHCRYCKGAAKCPATTNALQAALDTQAGLRSVLDMPEDDILALYASRSAIKNLMEDIEERVQALAKTGSAKLRIETKGGRRMWRNPKEATLTLLALGLDSCLAPGPLSEVIEQIPAQFRESLIGRARDSVSIKLVTETKPGAVAAAFRKYTTGVDSTGTTV